VAFLLNSQAQGACGKNEQSNQTPSRGAPEARGPMQLHQFHRLKAGPAYFVITYGQTFRSSAVSVLRKFWGKIN